MKYFSFPIEDGLTNTLGTYSEDAYIFCAPETEE